MADLPRFPVGPILEYYGSDPIEPDWNHHPIKCPFHGDRSPSATVTTTEEEQYFKCHSCGMKGNAAQLVMQKEGLSYWVSVERVRGIIFAQTVERFKEEGLSEKDAVRRTEAITGLGSGDVLKQPGTRSSVSGQAGNRSSYGEFKRTWLRD